MCGRPRRLPTLSHLLQIVAQLIDFPLIDEILDVLDGDRVLHGEGVHGRVVVQLRDRRDYGLEVVDAAAVVDCADGALHIFG
jgi:hypothetical protein